MYLIITAYVIDLIVGDPYWLPHPIRLIGLLISSIEKLFRKLIDVFKSYNKAKLEKNAGIAMTTMVILIVYSSIRFIQLTAEKADFTIFPKLIRNGFSPIFTILSVYLFFACLATRCLAVETKKVYDALKKKDLPEARKYLSYLVGRETSQLEEKEVIRAAVETVAENIVDGIISPVFYAFIGGVPLVFTYKAINTMDSMVGYMNEKYINFGYASAKLDDIANFIPARITGFIIPIASFFLKYDAASGYRIMWRDRHNHNSPNCAYPEAAVAGSLGVLLGGTNTYFGSKVYKSTMGADKRPLEPEDILRTIKIMYLTSFLCMVLFSTIYILIS